MKAPKRLVTAASRTSSTQSVGGTVSAWLPGHRRQAGLAADERPAEALLQRYAPQTAWFRTPHDPLSSPHPAHSPPLQCALTDPHLQHTPEQRAVSQDVVAASKCARCSHSGC